MTEFWSAITGFAEEYQVLFSILVIIVACLLANWLLRFLLRRAINTFVQGVKRSQNVDSTQEIVAGGHLKERAVQRTRTLGIFSGNVINILTALTAFFLILAQFNINLTAVITSAGFVAAGLAFGAQNVVKDVLNGIFLVFEDQLGIGDWVTIGDISGTVEDVGIRVSEIRAIDGTLWFVRNGEILTLGNASQGWGRALIDITVEAGTDIEEVTNVALRAAARAIKAPEVARKVTGEPEVWGVESAFGDRVTLRLAVRTRPEAHWAVQRALRPAIVSEFKQAGIKLATELPFFPGGAE